MTFPRLSILETTPIGPGVDFSSALMWTGQIAKLAESLAYDRIWIAEHHATIDCGCATPAVLMAHLASVTDIIRVGAGAVLLPNHPPLIVAEEFGILEGLYPGRIDLGIGRGIGADGVVLSALRRAAADDEAYASQIDELNGFLTGEFAVGHRYEEIKFPRAKTTPPVFILGASESSSLLAASRGLPFAFAHHQNPQGTASAVSAYRAAFRKSRQGSTPHVIASVRVLGRDTDADAAEAAVAATTVRLRATAARLHRLVVDEAVLLDSRVSDSERRLADSQLSKGAVLLGSPTRLSETLPELAIKLRVDEVMVYPLEYDGPSRMQTLRAVAEARRLAAANLH